MPARQTTFGRKDALSSQLDPLLLGIAGLGRPDGFGRYGILDVDEEGRQVLCHECGRWFSRLGRHAAITHQMPVEEYRAAHGLPHGLGLVAPAQAAQMASRARARMGSASWQRLQARGRSPEVKAARMAAFRTAVEGRPEQGVAVRIARAALASEMGRRSRRPLVLSCPICGALWCPLDRSRRTRRTCGSRACVLALIGGLARARMQQRRREDDPLRQLGMTEKTRERVIRRLAELGFADLDRYVQDRLQLSGWSRRAIADELGVTRLSLRSWLLQLGYGSGPNPKRSSRGS